MFFKYVHKYLSTLTLSFLSTLFTLVPVKAAEHISFYTLLGEFSISVTSLETFAKEGKIDSELAIYAQYASPEEMASLRELLQQRIKLSHVKVAQFLYSSMGELSLNYLGEYIKTDANLNGFYALRSSLILSAADKEGLNLINILKKYPSPKIRIESDAFLKIFASFTQLYEQTNKVAVLLKQQSQVESINDKIPANFFQKKNLQNPGSFTVQKQRLSLYDQKRQRAFFTDLYFPQNLDSVHFLVISHGLASDKADFAYLAQHLTSHGFAVAVVQHPGSDSQQLQAFLRGGAKDIIETNEFINRPKDISFLLDQLERLNKLIPDIKSRLNLQQVGIIGHSFGGYTALSVAGAKPDLATLKKECRFDNFNLNTGNVSNLLQCLALNLPAGAWTNLQDRRVKSVFAINPVGSSIFGEKGLNQIKIPVMLVASSNDTITPAVLEQVCPFSWLNTPNKYLAFIQSGTHSDATKPVNKNNLFLDDKLTSPNPELARSYLKAMTLAFAKTHVASQDKYQYYLHNNYAQTISKPFMPLTIVRSVTQNQLSQELQLYCPGNSSS